MKYLSITILLLIFSVLGLNAQSLEYFQIQAAENNPGLQAKYKAFEAALQSIDKNGGLPDPSLSFGYFISPVETRLGPQRARLSLSQMFPWFGTISAQQDAARKSAQAKYAQFLDERNRLFYQVSSAYYPLVELQLLLKLEEENIQSLSSFKAIAQAKLTSGSTVLADVLRAEIMLSDAISNQHILQQKERALNASLNVLLNQPPGTAIEISDSLQTPLVSALASDPLVTNNPLLSEVDAKIDASISSEESIWRQSFPKIGIGLDYVLVGKRDDASPDGNGRDILMPMVSVSLPLYRSKYKAAQKEAQLLRESYELQRQNLTNQLMSRSESATFEMNRQAQLHQLFKTQAKTARRTMNLLISAYQNDEASFESILTIQQELLKYKRNSINALTLFHIKKAELAYLNAFPVVITERKDDE